MKNTCRERINIVVLLFLLLTIAVGRVLAQAGFDDDRVMLQGFYWESYRHGHPEHFPQYGDKNWYTIVRENALRIKDGHFDLVWLPPPCFAGGNSAGYDPREYFNLNNSYGSADDQKAMLHELLKSGIEPVADLVLNHRNGSTGWTDFKNPNWGLWSICGDDECFSNPASGVAGTPMNQRGAEEESPSYRMGKDYAYGDFRDIDHSNPGVRRDVFRYMLMLKSAGYRGWRYDMVHGYSAHWLSLYNRYSQPTFSVGEYDWDKHPQMRGWIWASASNPGDLTTSSDVFDYPAFFTLKDNKGHYSAWYGYGNGPGIMGDTTDGIPWKNRAVTFLENHDTGYRTNEDGTTEKDNGVDKTDHFANNWEVEQGYAFILTHPGIPTVFWKHYFDWGDDLQNKIKSLINARKIAGVKSGSALYTQQNALTKGIYAAMVQGWNGQLYVRIGGSDDDWQPSFSGYKDYQDYAHGTNWKVWVSLPGNPPVKMADLRPALPLPEFKNATDIQIPESWLNE